MSRTVLAPRVSVILPVFNGGRFLAAAVESILKQSFSDFELIAIDDGSTDDSAVLLSSFARSDTRVRVITQANMGIVKSLNRALELARGEYIARMDADDEALPSRFSLQVAFLDTHPEIAVLGSAITLIDAAGAVMREIDYPLTPTEVDRFLMKAGSAFAHPAVMARRDAIQTVGGYRELLQHAEDYDLWLRMAERYSLANLPDRLLRYRHHDTKGSRRHATAQRLATHVARLCAAARRSGRPDPLEGCANLSLDDLDRFGLAADKRNAIMRDVMDMAPSLAARSRHAAVWGLRRALPVAWLERLRNAARARRSLSLC
jgi:glycosyltransferase involved in cell wall biosynthesis